jgi:hypothetical protein
MRSNVTRKEVWDEEERLEEDRPRVGRELGVVLL